MTRIVFTNANLLDGDNAAQARSTLVVDGERISEIVNGAVPQLRPDDTVYDLGGRTLMPGLVQSHYHATYTGAGADMTPVGMEAPPALQATCSLA